MFKYTAKLLIKLLTYYVLLHALPLAAAEDSLINITRTRADTHAVNAFFELGRQNLADKNYEAAIRYFDNGDSLANLIGFNMGRLRLIRAKSVYYGRTGNIKRGHELNKQGLELAGKINAPPELVVDFLINQGALYFWEDKIANAIEPYLQAVAICRTHQLDQKRSILLNNLGIFYRNLERYPEAISIYEEALRIRQENKDTMGTANILFNMAASYGSMDSAKLAYEAILRAEILYRQLESNDDLLLCQNAKGSFLLDMQRYEEAYQYLAPLAKRNDLNFSPWRLSALHIQMAKIYEHQELWEQAGNELDKIEDILLSTNYTEWLMEYYRLRHLENKFKGNIGLALESMEKYQALSDTINNERQEKYRQEMLEKYLSVEKDYQISQQQLQLVKNEKKRNQLILLILVLLSIGGASILFLRKRHNYRYQLSLRDNALKQEKILKLQQEKKIIALDYMLEGEARERHRIARDLHDSIGSLLTSAKFHLRQIQENSVNLLNEPKFQKAQEIVGNAADEVRRISHDMMPDALVNLGLQAAIQDLADKIQNAVPLAIICHFFEVEENHISDSQKLGIYRIVQELLQNIVKHAHANQVVVQLSQEQQTLHLVVEDDGIGFNLNDLDLKEGIGLKNIRSRVQYLDGELNISSSDGGPTEFDIVIPV